MGRFQREHVAEVYSQFDVLVVPSLWLENSPLVIHEAFMTRTPVVRAGTGGIANLVQHGENGLLSPPESSAALADALRRLAIDRDCLQALRARATPVTSIDDDAAAWELRYMSVLPAGPNR